MDIDEIGNDLYDIELPQVLSSLMPYGNKIICKVPSKSGYHYITTKFNVEELLGHPQYTDLEIKKDNFTNLYISG